MRLIVNHLGRNFHPRMTVGGVTTILRPGTQGDIFIGGVRVDSPHAMVLPRPFVGRLAVEDLARNGGHFQLGAVIDAPWCAPEGRAPDTEEHTYEDVEVIERWDRDRFWAFSASLAVGSLAEIFGPRLQVGSGRTVAIPSRSAVRSCGVFEPRGRPRLFVDDRGYVRCELRDPHLGSVNIGVSDHRFFEMRGWEVEEPDIVMSDVVQTVNQRLRSGVAVLLGLCLHYIFPVENPRQSLKVSGVNLRDDPYWGDH